MYAVTFCLQNSRIEREWDDWTAHLSGPPSSWQSPSNEYQRFEDKVLTYRSTDGLTRTLWGFKDDAGSVVIEPRFAACGRRFYEGMAWASDPHAKRSGWINPDGTWAIIVNGTTHSDFIGGMGKYQMLDSYGYPLYGFVSQDGKVIVPAKYRTADWYVNGYVLVRERTWVGRIADYVGKEVGVFPRTCFETRSIILDKLGHETSLPSQ